MELMNLLKREIVISARYGVYFGLMTAYSYMTFRRPPHEFIWYWIRRLIKPKIVTKNILGNLMQLDISDRGANVDLFFDGKREVKCTEYFQSIMKPDWTVLDIGAHIGYYALQEARRVKKVIAVEPIKRTFEVLEHNLRLNHISNVQTMCVALGNTVGITKFNTNCYSNVCHVAFRESSDTVGIPMNKVDDVFAKERIDYIRMDVEGYSFNILKGAERTIKNNSLGMFIEVHRDYLQNYGATLKEFMDWLSAHGMWIDKSIFKDNKYTKGLKFDGDPKDFMSYPPIAKVVDKWGLDTFWLFMSKKND